MTHLRGKFIVFDGGEGCGKSTQSALLRSALESAGVPVQAVRDPGSTDVGEKIRAILLNPDQAEMAMRCEMLLYMAARAQMMKELIAPALDTGKCIVCDRFVSSTLAYQSGGDNLTDAQIRTVAEVAISARWPDLTIILDMPVEKSSARLTRQRDRIEQRPPEYHQKVRERYLEQAKADPRHYRVVSADRPPQAVHEEVLKIVTFMQDNP
jgi:dTMP kinase